jgi:HEAT repeat protein
MLWWKLQRLKSRDPKSRRRAVEELAGREDTAMLIPLTAALSDAEADVRAAAARVLGTYQDERISAPLIAALNDRKPEVRAAALASLRQHGDAKILPRLIPSLDDSSHLVRWQAASALNGFGWRPGNPNEFILHAVAMGHHEEAAVHGSKAVEALTRALEDPTCPRRSAAAAALGKAGDARAVPHLELALKDADSQVRVAAVEALSQLGQTQSANALLELIRDPDNHVRATVIEALGRMGDTRIIEPIASHLLQDASWDVRKLSVEALGRIKHERCTQLLWQALKDADHDVRQTAAQALGNIPEPRSIGPLVLTLKDENSSVRQAAKGSLRQIDRQWELSPGAQSVIPELEAALSDKEYWVAQSAADTLAKINDMRQQHLETSFVTNPAHERSNRAVSILVDTLRDFDRDLRQAAVEALGRIGDSNTIHPLVSALDDQDDAVGRAAALALNHLNWEPAVDDFRRREKVRTLMLQA